MNRSWLHDAARVGRRVRGVGAAAMLLLVIACLHARHVGERGDGERRGGASEKEERGASPRATKERIPPRDGRPAVAASPEGLMNPGSARRIQDALRSKGYLEGPGSGELDPATSAALRRFQRDQGFAETGAPDRETLRRLGIDTSDVYRTGSGGKTAEHAPP